MRNIKLSIFIMLLICIALFGQVISVKASEVKSQEMQSPEMLVPLHVIEGDEVEIKITTNEKGLAQGEMIFTYRPGSMVELILKNQVPRIAPNTEYKVVWKPKEPGIVRVDYKTHYASSKKELLLSSMVGVSFPSTPIGGILVMLFAACILFGGVVFSLRLLIGKK